MSNLQLITNDSHARKISILAGVIRRINGKWSFINDANHESIGFKPNIIENTNSSIQIMFDKKYSKVLTCSVTADEAYVKNGIQFGASCGLDKVVIFHSRSGSNTTNAQLEINSSNIWIHILMFD